MYVTRICRPGRRVNHEREALQIRGMAPPLRIPRERWIEEGLRALAGGGPEAVRIEPLARRLGVTRGGFYHHFADRAALLSEMLDLWERRVIDEVLTQVEQERSDPRTRAVRAGALTFDAKLMPVELAIRDWARRDTTIAERLQHVDNARMGYLREQFRTITKDDDELEARCTLAFGFAIGNHFMTPDHGDHSPAEVLRNVINVLWPT
jgi:AcrR family transcriptional regulator